jgi:hypothetical protein
LAEGGSFPNGGRRSGVGKVDHSLGKKGRTIMSIRFLSLFVGGILFVACDGILGPEDKSRVGTIAFHGDPVVIEVPDTVRAGVSFGVSVRTYGGGCLSEGGTTVQVRGLSADVTPYDLHSGASLCTADLRTFTHEAALSFEEPGVAQIRFHGKQMPEDSLITLVRELVVK